MSTIVVNGFNVGTDLQEVILTSSLGSFPCNQLGHLKKFNAKQESTQVICTPVPYGGRRFHRNIYHDWSGSFEFTRFNAQLTAIVAQIMRNFQATGQETYWSAYTQIANSSAGSRDNFLFQQMVLDQHDLGSFEGTNEVGNSISFRCQSMLIT